MALSVTHSTVATLADEPGAEVNKAEWNAAHTITGAGTMAEQAASAVAITGGTISGITSISLAGDITKTAASTFYVNSASGQNIRLNPGSAGRAGTSNGFDFYAGAIMGRAGSFHIFAQSVAIFGWGSSAGDNTGTNDTGVARNAAGIAEINNGTAGTFRDLKLRNIVGQTGYTEVVEMTAPAAPAANNVRLYAEDNGAGKTRLMALFATGAAVQIAIEP